MQAKSKRETLIKNRSRATAAGENVIKKKGRWIAKKLWLFRKRRASDGHNNVDTPLKYFGLTKSSHWLFVMENAPLRVDPGNFPFSLNPSFFPPLPSARQQFIYIIVYAGSFLPPRRTHNDFSCWCFPPFSQVFPRYYNIYSPLPPLSVSAPQNTPFLGFFGVFPSHAQI